MFNLSHNHFTHQHLPDGAGPVYKILCGQFFFIRPSPNKNIYFNEMFNNWCWTSGQKFGVTFCTSKTVFYKNLIIPMRQNIFGLPSPLFKRHKYHSLNATNIDCFWSFICQHKELGVSLNHLITNSKKMVCQSNI